MTGKEVTRYFMSRRYNEVIHRLQSEGNTDKAGEKKRRELAFRATSQAYLRTGQHEKAIGQLLEVLGAYDRTTASDYCELGAAYWIASKQGLAVDTWTTGASCSYGDSAGNITPGLLLYYAGIRLSDEKIKRQGIDHVQSKLKTGWSKNWPAALGRFLLNIETEAEVGEEIANQHPLRMPDELCRFYFYKGVKQLEFKDEEEAAVFFRSAVQVAEQITWTTEFVLACYEDGSFGG